MSSLESSFADPELRHRLRQRLLNGGRGGPAGQWTARKGQLLIEEYRSAGGRLVDTLGQPLGDPVAESHGGNLFGWGNRVYDVSRMAEAAKDLPVIKVDPAQFSFDDAFIDVQDAMTKDLASPVLMARRPGGGTMLVDGWHRAFRAHAEGKPLKAKVLSHAQFEATVVPRDAKITIEEDASGLTFPLRPPAAVVSAMRRGLAAVAAGKAGSGFEAATAGRARAVVNGGGVSKETLGRMASFFARHGGQGAGGKGASEAQRTAWDVWGGNAGAAWARKMSAKLQEDARADGHPRLDELFEKEFISQLTKFKLGKKAKAQRRNAQGEFAPGGMPKGILAYDASPLTFGKGAGGSNGARWAHHENGQKWLVKTYGMGKYQQDRIATELLANAVYREMGASVAPAGKIKLYDGRQALAYPTVDGEIRPYVFKKEGPSEELGKHFMTDALLANWDVAGLEDDNVLWDADGRPVRLDQGGTLMFRAQGQLKKFGAVPLEVKSMRTGGGQARRAMAVDDADMRQQARDIAARLTPERVKELTDSAGFSSPQLAAGVRTALNARVAWMGRFGAGLVDEPQLAEAYLAEDWSWDLKLEEAAKFTSFLFKEAEHPRDQYGRFRKTIGGLMANEGLKLNSSVRVNKEKNGSYTVRRGTEPARGFTNPTDAARYALDQAVKGTKADDIGGAVKYKDFNAYLKARGVDINTPSAFGGRTDVSAAEFAQYISATENTIQTVKAAEYAAPNEGKKKDYRRTLGVLQARLKEAKQKRAALTAVGAAPPPSAPSAPSPQAPTSVGWEIPPPGTNGIGLELKKGDQLKLKSPHGEWVGTVIKDSELGAGVVVTNASGKKYSVSYAEVLGVKKANAPATAQATQDLLAQLGGDEGGATPTSPVSPAVADLEAKLTNTDVGGWATLTLVNGVEVLAKNVDGTKFTLSHMDGSPLAYPQSLDLSDEEDFKSKAALFKQAGEPSPGASATSDAKLPVGATLGKFASVDAFLAAVPPGTQLKNDGGEFTFEVIGPGGSGFDIKYKNITLHSEFEGAPDGPVLSKMHVAATVNSSPVVVGAKIEKQPSAAAFVAKYPPGTEISTLGSTLEVVGISPDGKDVMMKFEGGSPDPFNPDAIGFENATVKSLPAAPESVASSSPGAVVSVNVGDVLTPNSFTSAADLLDKLPPGSVISPPGTAPVTVIGPSDNPGKVKFEVGGQEYNFNYNSAAVLTNATVTEIAGKPAPVASPTPSGALKAGDTLTSFSSVDDLLKQLPPGSVVKDSDGDKLTIVGPASGGYVEIKYHDAAFAAKDTLKVDGGLLPGGEVVSVAGASASPGSATYQPGDQFTKDSFTSAEDFLAQVPPGSVVKPSGSTSDTYTITGLTPDGKIAFTDSDGDDGTMWHDGGIVANLEVVSIAPAPVASATPSGATYQPGDKFTDTSFTSAADFLAQVPPGSVLKAPSDTFTITGLTPDGTKITFTDSDGDDGQMWHNGIVANLKVVSIAPGAAPKGAAPNGGEAGASAPYSGKPIKGFQKVPLGEYGNTWKVKETKLEVGDVIQDKKGGWKYEVTEVGTSGWVKGKTASGKEKILYGSTSLYTVKKADGSPVALKAPSTVPAAAATPQPKSPSELLNAISDKLQPGPGKYANMESLVDGAVFETPAGQVGVLAKTETAYSGYLTAYDVKTGAKFEPHATNYPPHKATEDPSAMAAAQELLKQLNAATATPAPTSPSASASAGTPAPAPMSHSTTSFLPTWTGALKGKAAEDHLFKQQPTLSSQAKQAVAGYTNGTYGTINNELRKGNVSKSTLKHSHAMDQAFHDVPPLDVDTITHRGAQMTDFFYEGNEIKKGMTIQDLGYMSTSPTKPWTKDVQLHMRVKAGTKCAIWAANVSSHSSERELIIKRAAIMEVLEVAKVGSVTHIYVDVWG